MPYENEHSARINEPSKYKKFRRENNKFGTGIDVIWGILSDGKTEIQAIRFDKNKFSVSEAKKWLKDHDYSPIEFAEASEKSMNDEIEYKTFNFNFETIDENKANHNDSLGIIKGYASTFDVIDYGDDVVEHGAFLKTIDRCQKEGDKIPMCFQHSIMHIIGGFDPAKMYEDDKGLHVEGEIYKKTSMGADVYELAKRGVLNKMSFGFTTNDVGYENGDGKTIRKLKDINLYEISMVSHPMNPHARITDIKADKAEECISINEFIGIISNRDISLNEKKSLVSQILRKNILSRNAADYIVSFIFKEKQQNKNESKSNELKMISDLLAEIESKNKTKSLTSTIKEIQAILK
jgi:HK97 family phage prohead protease